MNDEAPFMAGFLSGVLLGMFGAFFIAFLATNLGPDQYTQGQIDALTGKVKVELVESPDGSKNWKRKAGE